MSKKTKNSKTKDKEILDKSQDDQIGNPSYEELFDLHEELKESNLRLRADLENSIKRTRAEVEKAHKFGVENLLNELLPVIDNLENALSNLDKDSSNEDHKGIELTLKSFEKALDKFGMIPIYPIDEIFNPEKHEAVSMEQDKSKEDNQVGTVFQRGWELNGRVVRPARITVIKN